MALIDFLLTELRGNLCIPHLTLETVVWSLGRAHSKYSWSYFHVGADPGPSSACVGAVQDTVAIPHHPSVASEPLTEEAGALVVRRPIIISSSSVARVCSGRNQHPTESGSIYITCSLHHAALCFCFA